ncbi:hypothetical protein PIB30_002094 [Stylosanthes scabra]|uniref:Uncharacterized protein n=1 Tax=Stylosanthes scabra TaxID=79078 RepID=A0ABU6R2Q9_9FABA|nr:hypothetical protein [Stylosanthes scabra]
MAKHTQAWMAMPKKRWPLMLVAFLSLSTAMVLFIRPNSCVPCTTTTAAADNNNNNHFVDQDNQIRSSLQLANAPSPLDFMKSKLVLMVSHELSLSGGPLLLMELAFLLRGVGADVVWITNQKPPEPDQVIYSLESKMLDRGVQVLPAKGEKAVETAIRSDLVILNTAVAGKWLDAVLKEKVSLVLPKVP